MWFILKLYIDSYRYKPEEIPKKYEEFKDFTHAISTIKINSLNETETQKQYFFIENDKMNILKIIKDIKNNHKDELENVYFTLKESQSGKNICVLFIKEKSSLDNVQKPENRVGSIKVNISILLNHLVQLGIIYNDIISHEYDENDADSLAREMSVIQTIQNISDLLYKSSKDNIRIDIKYDNPYDESLQDNNEEITVKKKIKEISVDGLHKLLD